MNWLGLWTLYKKEVTRFVKVYLQTILAPVFTSLIFLSIFTLALGTRIQQINEVSFVEFIVPGLIMMSMIQNAFGNASSSIMISKVQRSLLDILMAPISAVEFTAAYALACLTRGIAVGIAVGTAMYLFIPLQIHSYFAIIFFGTAASFALGLFGVIASILSEKFDQLAAFTNFVITPLSFLSGTFYSIDRLQGYWSILAYINPFFYMIDGFRSGFIGTSDTSIYIGIPVVIAFNVFLWMICVRIIQTGYKLKN